MLSPTVSPSNFARAILDEEVKDFFVMKKERKRNALYINVLHNDVC